MTRFTMLIPHIAVIYVSIPLDRSARTNYVATKLHLVRHMRRKIAGKIWSKLGSFRQNRKSLKPNGFFSYFNAARYWPGTSG